MCGRRGVGGQQQCADSKDLWDMGRTSCGCSEGVDKQEMVLNDSFFFWHVKRKQEIEEDEWPDEARIQT